MPRINGYQCLKSLQSGLQSSRTPVVMYSTSENPKDINIAYGLGATLYLKKPSRYPQLKKSIQGILNMAWEEPASIKQEYFKNGKYYPYEVV
jgi:DNA-binding NarL/FixJ family response regulator